MSRAQRRSVVGNRDRVNLDQVLGSSQRLNTYQRVDRLVVAEQRNPRVLDHGQVLRPVSNNEDRDLGYLISPRAGRRKSTAEIGEHLTCLCCQVTEPDYIALTVLGLLAGDEKQPASQWQR